ncbi:hypothetical protein FMUND_329 [Fusarium mundagurra]|uniref:Uncharacterized protein n=1 Tax=Fusarium mundagurra TaxID=1567541 RepID=A0A8H5Z686_9HYPO|nr:hypothetical protein FMUND_329 [Fusarium mundagurra]
MNVELLLPQQADHKYPDRDKQYDVCAQNRQDFLALLVFLDAYRSGLGWFLTWAWCCTRVGVRQRLNNEIVDSGVTFGQRPRFSDHEHDQRSTQCHKRFRIANSLGMVADLARMFSERYKGQAMYNSFVGMFDLLNAGDVEGVANTHWMWRLYRIEPEPSRPLTPQSAQRTQAPSIKTARATTANCEPLQKPQSDMRPLSHPEELLQ